MHVLQRRRMAGDGSGKCPQCAGSMSCIRYSTQNGNEFLQRNEKNPLRCEFDVARFGAVSQFMQCPY